MTGVRGVDDGLCGIDRVHNKTEPRDADVGTHENITVGAVYTVGFNLVIRRLKDARRKAGACIEHAVRERRIGWVRHLINAAKAEHSVRDPIVMQRQAANDRVRHRGTDHATRLIHALVSDLLAG